MWPPSILIAFRALQGLTAALMVPQVSAIIQVDFPPEERGGAFGLLGAVVGLGTIAGPLLGGLLIGANLWGLSWRPIFLINLPIGMIAFIGTAHLVRESRAATAQQLDVGGAALIGLALTLFVYPLIEGRTLGWPWWIFGTLAAALGVLGLFSWDQRRKAARGVAVLVDPALFRDRAFRIGLPISLVFFSGVYSFFLALSICLQGGFGFSPLTTALMIVPFQSASLVTSLLLARAARRLGKRVLLLGSALLCCGVGGVVATMATVDQALSGPVLLPALVIGGAGFGLIVGPLTTVILAGVQTRFAAAAAGVLSTAQQVGGALGIAVMGVVLFGQIEQPSVHVPHLSRAVLFSTATQRTLLFNLAVFVATFVLFHAAAVTAQRTCDPD